MQSFKICCTFLFLPAVLPKGNMKKQCPAIVQCSSFSLHSFTGCSGCAAKTLILCFSAYASCFFFFLFFKVCSLIKIQCLSQPEMVFWFICGLDYSIKTQRRQDVTHHNTMMRILLPRQPHDIFNLTIITKLSFLKNKNHNGTTYLSFFQAYVILNHEAGERYFSLS